MQWGKSCKGPSPQADLKSFHPVVHKRALESTLAPSVGAVPSEVHTPWTVERQCLGTKNNKNKNDSGLDSTTTSTQSS